MRMRSEPHGGSGPTAQPAELFQVVLDFWQSTQAQSPPVLRQDGMRLSQEAACRRVQKGLDLHAEFAQQERHQTADMAHTNDKRLTNSHGFLRSSAQ
jgi:hypothetical protein